MSQLGFDDSYVAVDAYGRPIYGYAPDNLGVGRDGVQQAYNVLTQDWIRTPVQRNNFISTMLPEVQTSVAPRPVSSSGSRSVTQPQVTGNIGGTNGIGENLADPGSGYHYNLLGNNSRSFSLFNPSTWFSGNDQPASWVEAWNALNPDRPANTLSVAEQFEAQKLWNQQQGLNAMRNASWLGWGDLGLKAIGSLWDMWNANKSLDFAKEQLAWNQDAFKKQYNLALTDWRQARSDRNYNRSAFGGGNKTIKEPDNIAFA